MFVGYERKTLVEWCSSPYRRSRAGSVHDLLEHVLQVRDLLIEKGSANRNLEVQNTRNSGTNVPDAQQIEVSNTQDVLDVMDRGQTNRATADTKMNEVRSPHCRAGGLLSVHLTGSFAQVFKSQG